MFDNEKHCYSVSEVNASIKMLLESRFPELEISGEISNYRPASSGHAYFSLKDQHSMIQGVIFRNDLSKLDFQPKDGMKVIANGRISLYAQRGNYQIICNSLKEQGKGSILELLEKRKMKLASEGLFDARFKKDLPPYPKRLVVITSPTGAALRDIMQVMKRRNSSIHISILPCTVQGDLAAKQIEKQIKRANYYNLGDLIILARGGGSLEDLLPFSEENVVRAISSSTIPVISGIGHEIDFSLSDFVADQRASTPSSAAELVCRSSNEIMQTVENYKNEMSQAIQAQISLVKSRLNSVKPLDLQDSFNNYLSPFRMEIDYFKESLKRDVLQQIESYKFKVALTKKDLQANSPLRILEKGYSLVTNSKGITVKNAKILDKNEKIHIRFASGRIEANVEDINE